MWIISGISSGSKNSWIRNGAGKIGTDRWSESEILGIGIFYPLHVDDSCPSISLSADPSFPYIQYALKYHINMDQMLDSVNVYLYIRINTVLILLLYSIFCLAGYVPLMMMMIILKIFSFSIGDVYW